MTLTLTQRRAAALALLIGLVLCFLGTWTSALFDADEPRFAESTREMLASGDFLVPHLNGEYRFDKPILVYWVQAAGYALFGVGEAGARLPSVIGLALAAFFTARIASRIFQPRAGLLAGLVLLSCVQSGITGRAATADGLLLGTVMLAIDGLHSRLRGDRSILTWLMVWGGLGLATLTKGPAAWPAILGAGLSVVLVTKDRGAPRRLVPALLGVLFAAGLVFAWFLPANAATGGEFLRYGVGHHAGARALTPFEGHGGYEPWWFLFYVPVVILFFFPWSAWLPQGYRFFRSGAVPAEDRRFLASWILTTFLIFTASISKMPHYVLPLYPALAVILGGFLSRRIEEGRSLFHGPGSRWSLGYLTAVGALVAVAAPSAIATAGFPVRWISALPATLILAGFLTAVWILRRQPLPWVQTFLTFLAVAAVFIGLTLWTLSDLNQKRLVWRAGQALSKAVPATAPRAWVDFRPDGLVFYTQRDEEGRLTARGLKRLKKLDRGREILAWLRSREPRALILTEARAEKIRRHQGIDALPGRRVWRRRGFYAKRARWETVEIHVSEGAAARESR